MQVDRQAGDSARQRQLHAEHDDRLAGLQPEQAGGPGAQDQVLDRNGVPEGLADLRESAQHAGAALLCEPGQWGQDLAQDLPGLRLEVPDLQLPQDLAGAHDLRQHSCGPRGVAPQIVRRAARRSLAAPTTSDITSTSVNAPVVLTLGVSKSNYGALNLPFDLSPLGASGCQLLCSVEATSAAVVNAKYQAVFPVQLPNNTSLVGVRYFHQGWLITPVANNLGIAFSNAAEVLIGQ